MVEPPHDVDFPFLAFSCSTALWTTSHLRNTFMQGGGETGVMASILSTTGELAKVAGSSLRPHVGDILPLIIDAVGQPNGAGKSVVAVITLGQASTAFIYCTPCIT